MRTLVYKRTHEGDPDSQGRFGCRDCMGGVRAWPFNAVIGVGGIGSEPERAGISGLVTWIGIGPDRQPAIDLDWRGPIVTFDHFRHFGQAGPSFNELAPTLSARVYENNLRTVMTFTVDEQKEIDAILKLAKRSPQSPVRAQRAALAKRRQPGRNTSRTGGCRRPDC